MTDIGVVAGLSGIALFQFYYSKFLDIEGPSEVGAEIISFCIEKINDGYSLPTYCNGIAGLGWAIQHLKVEDFINLDCDALLSNFDKYLYDQMVFDFNLGNYDFLHGALGHAFYFLSRYKHTEDLYLKKRYESYLLEGIKNLKKLAIQKDNSLKWKSILDINKGNEGYNLSLSHGISSILNFSSRLHAIDAFKEVTEKLVIGSANYILSFQKKNSKNLSLFPSWIEKDISPEYNSRIAWCYGDLGIGLSILRAGQSLRDVSMQKHALEIIAHTTTRKSPDETLVKDAGVCHGSYGNSLIYQRLHQTISNPLFQKSLHFWLDNGVEKAIHKDGYAGYKQWNGLEKKWMPELNLLEGVAGIGLVIIEYLSEEPNFWDECLMIS